ncbi:MAG: leucine-rich repeat protein [Clostridia bacterium]|nr:leucine-rich repeat protein [Clostridia bacterium]
MKKNGLKRVLVIITVLLLVIAAVAVAIFATSVANRNAENAKLTIEATNLSFSDSVYIKYGVACEGVNADDVTLLVWTDPQTKYVVGTEDAVLENVGTEVIDGTECVIFNFTGLAAKQMTDNVYAVAYAKVGTTDVYSAPKKYSILQYAYNKMGITGTKTEDAKLITLLEDMLSYGALAQKYTNYKTDTLATDTFRQIKLVGGTLSDNFNHGLYKVGTNVTITAPEADDGFTFVGWKDNATGEIVSTSATATIEVKETNVKYSAVYQGNTSDKLEYTINDDEVTYSVSGIGSCTDTNIVIPSVVGGKLVTSVSAGAFEGCDNIKSITLSRNITSIGEGAFDGCTSLKAIYFAGNKYEWSLVVKGVDIGLAEGTYTVYYGDTDSDWGVGGIPLG